MEIAEAASDVCRILWILNESDFGISTRVLQKVGTVVNSEGHTPEELIQLVHAERPDGITCYWDPDLHLQAWLASALGLPTTPIQTVARLNDKLLQREAHKAAGVPVPKFSEVMETVDQAEVDRLCAEVSFPALLKPRNGTACQGIHLVESSPQLARLLGDIDHPGRMILEERMEDLPLDEPYADRISIETIACEGVYSHLGITGLFRMMPPFRSTGGFFPADVPPSTTRELFELATEAIKALGSDFGFYRTEIKLTPQGPKIIEINGRPTGLTPTVVKLASGIPLLELGMRLSLGERIVVEGPVPCERIAYRYYYEPPMSATKVLTISGLSALGDLPGVRQIDVHKAVGDTVDWRNGSLDKIFQVTGTVGSYAELAEHHAACADKSYVTYEHDRPTGEETPGRELI
ncbi:MAG TPA: ATP-grasp domain-containing protein [Acidimicrobiales bacterium]|nr:ATP-grasp domain-containing protein [Acidimicrobiales bacterium]